MEHPPSPARLLEIAAGYQRSKALFALIQLGVPTMLGDGALESDEIARRVGLDPIACESLLGACAALGVLERDGDRYANAPDAQRYLVRGTERDLSPYFNWQDAVYVAWSAFDYNLRHWRPGAGTTGADQDAPPARARGVIEAMEGAGAARAHHSLALVQGEALAESVDLSRQRRLLDLGGGSGATSIALCRRNPELNAVVLERPEVVPVAREFIAASELSHRIEVREGDFMRDPLPGGFDTALLGGVMALSNAVGNRDLLARVHDALPAGGLILIAGWMLHDDRDASPLRSLFSLEDIRWGAPDVERCAETYSDWLRYAGFTGIERRPYLEPASVLIAHKA